MPTVNITARNIDNHFLVFFVVFFIVFSSFILTYNYSRCQALFMPIGITSFHCISHYHNIKQKIPLQELGINAL